MKNNYEFTAELPKWEALTNDIIYLLGKRGCLTRVSYMYIDICKTYDAAFNLDVNQKAYEEALQYVLSKEYISYTKYIVAGKTHLYVELTDKGHRLYDAYKFQIEKNIERSIYNELLKKKPAKDGISYLIGKVDQHLNVRDIEKVLKEVMNPEKTKEIAGELINDFNKLVLNYINQPAADEKPEKEGSSSEEHKHVYNCQFESDRFIKNIKNTRVLISIEEKTIDIYNLCRNLQAKEMVTRNDLYELKNKVKFLNDYCSLK